MLAACLLLTAATVGVDFGWQSTDKGELEYVIQFEPELIEQLKSGKAVSTQLPPEMAGRVRAFRIQIGTGDLDKTIPAGFMQQSKSEEVADERPRLLAVNTPILSAPPVPLSAARREIQASIDAATDLVAQYTPRSTRTLPRFSDQSGSDRSTTTNSQSQSQATQPPPTSELRIPGASERYGDSTTASRFNDGQSTATGSSSTTPNPGSSGSQFSNNSGTSNSSASGQQAPDLGRFSSGDSINTTGINNGSSSGANNNGSVTSGSTTSGQGTSSQGTNNGQATSGGQTGSNDGNSTRGRWGNRGPQTDHQPLNGSNDPSLVSPVNQNQWTTQQPQQNNPQQGNGQPPLAGGGYGNPNMNPPDFTQTGQGGNNPIYNQNPQQNYQAPPLYNTGNQGNYGQYPQQQQQPNPPPYGYPNQNGYPNQGPVQVASLPQHQQPPPAATQVSTEASKPEEKTPSPSDTPAPSEPEVITEVKVEAPEWWFMVAIGFMMSLFFNFWSWKVSQEIRQKYDDLLEDVRDMRSLPEA